MQATINDLHYNHSRQLNAKQDPVTDEQLILEYRRSGDRERFAQLVYRYERELFSFLRRFLGNAEMAEDVFQAAFLQVHLKCESFEAGRRFRPWLYAIATNAAIDARRRNQRQPKVSLDSQDEQQEAGRLIDLLQSGESSPADSAIEAEASQLVRQTLEQLPESMQAVIHLVYYQGMKYRDAAEILQVPVGTIKSRLHSAIAKITEVWQTSNRVD
jgi:RNA polymerase sigma-70 factor (ECF subfamily)